MTTGTKIINNLQSVACYDWPHPGNLIIRGYGNKGHYYSKTWSGTDSPPVNRVIEWEEYPFFYRDDRGRPKVAWKKRRKRLPPRIFREPHPYSMSLLQYSDDNIVYWIKDFYPPYANIQDSERTFRYMYNEGYSTPVGKLWTGNDEVALAGKLRQKVAGSDFNMGVFLGEGREALSMIFGAANQLTGALRAARRLDVAGMAKALKVTHRTPSSKRETNPKFVFERWLEMQYGWLPLLGDAKSGAESLAKLLEHPMVAEYRVRIRRQYDLIPVSNISTFKSQGSLRAQMVARLTEVDVPKLYGLTDPASVAWELVPFSFVADWFIPIGDYLAARGLARSLTGTFVKSILTEELFGVNKVNYGSQTTITKQPFYRSLKKSLERTVSPTLSIPTPSIKPLNEVFSWKRAANAVSLIAVAFGSSASDNHQQGGLRTRGFNRKRWPGNDAYLI